MIRRGRSLTVAYTLFAFVGFQGVHQFYLGRWGRGLMIAFLIHVPCFWFAYLDQKAKATGEPQELVPMLFIFFGLLGGLGMWLYDLVTLRKQLQALESKSP